MPPERIRSILVVLIGTGRFTKSFLKRKRELTEDEIEFLLNEGYIEYCGTNSVNELLYCVSLKGQNL